MSSSPPTPTAFFTVASGPLIQLTNCPVCKYSIQLIATSTQEEDLTNNGRQIPLSPPEPDPSTTSPWLKSSTRNNKISSIASVHRVFNQSDAASSSSSPVFYNFFVAIIFDDGAAATKVIDVNPPTSPPSGVKIFPLLSSAESSRHYIPISVNIASFCGTNNSNSAISDRSIGLNFNIKKIGNIKISVSSFTQKTSFEEYSKMEMASEAYTGVQSVMDEFSEENDNKITELLSKWSNAPFQNLDNPTLENISSFSAGVLRDKENYQADAGLNLMAHAVNKSMQQTSTTAVVSNLSTMFPPIETQLSGFVKAVGITAVHAVNSLVDIAKEIPHLGSLISIVAKLFEMKKTNEEVQKKIKSLRSKIVDIFELLISNKALLQQSERKSYFRRRIIAIREVGLHCMDVIEAQDKKSALVRVLRFFASSSTLTLLSKLEEQLQREISTLTLFITADTAADVKQIATGMDDQKALLLELIQDVKTIKQNQASSSSSLSSLSATTANQHSDSSPNSPASSLSNSASSGGIFGVFKNATSGLGSLFQSWSSPTKAGAPSMPQPNDGNGNNNNSTTTSNHQEGSNNQQQQHQQQQQQQQQQKVDLRAALKTIRDNLALQYSSVLADQDECDVGGNYINLRIFDRREDFSSTTNSASTNAAAATADPDKAHVTFQSCTVDTISKHINRENVMLVDGVGGSGKTTFCKRLCKTQTVEDYLCVFIRLRDLEGFPITTVQRLLARSLPQSSRPVFCDEDRELIARENVPLLFVLDGFDEVQSTTDMHLKQFLENFVDPVSRRAQLRNNGSSSLIRSCDAVLVTSREDRVLRPEAPRCRLDLSIGLGGPTRWFLEAWDEVKVKTYCLLFFQARAKDFVINEHRWQNMARVISERLSQHMSGFSGLPLMASMLCKFALQTDNASTHIQTMTPATLFDLRIRSHLEGLVKKGVDVDIEKTIHEASIEAFNLMIDLHNQGGAVEFSSPSNGAPPCFQHLETAGLLRRDRHENKDTWSFQHRMFMEYLAAVCAESNQVVKNGNKSLDVLPLRPTFRSVWLLLVDKCKTKSDQRLQEISNLIGNKFYAIYQNTNIISAAEKRRLNDVRDVTIVDDLKEKFPMRLIVEMSVVANPAMIFDGIDQQRWFYSLRSYPDFFKKFADLCGEFGADTTLNWLLAKRIVTPTNATHSLQSCLARAMQRFDMQSQMIVRSLRETHHITPSLVVSIQADATRSAIALFPATVPSIRDMYSYCDTAFQRKNKDLLAFLLLKIPNVRQYLSTSSTDNDTKELISSFLLLLLRSSRLIDEDFCEWDQDKRGFCVPRKKSQLEPFKSLAVAPILEYNTDNSGTGVFRKDPRDTPLLSTVEDGSSSSSSSSSPWIFIRCEKSNFITDIWNDLKLSAESTELRICVGGYAQLAQMQFFLSQVPSLGILKRISCIYDKNLSLLKDLNITTETASRVVLDVSACQNSSETNKKLIKEIKEKHPNCTIVP